LGDGNRERVPDEGHPPAYTRGHIQALGRSLDRIHADFSEEQQWTDKLESAKVVDTDGFAFAFDE
jgi:hypothetical protein